MEINESLQKLKEEIFNCPNDKICFDCYNKIRILLGRRTNKSSEDKIKIMFIAEGPKESFEPDKFELLNAYKNENYVNEAYLRTSDGNIVDSRGESFGLYSKTGMKMKNKILNGKFKNFKDEPSFDDISWLTNCVKCSLLDKGKLGNSRVCSNFIKREIEIIDPDVLVLLGSKSTEVIGKDIEHNKIYSVFIGRERKVVNSKHPANRSFSDKEILGLRDSIKEILKE